MIDNKTIRKVIMLNKMLPGGSPVYENREASGAVANFTTNTVQPFVKCECEILPIQEGTGTPSPSNPRPIRGTSVLDIKHSGSDTSDYDTISVNLGQEIMGGTADVVGGVGTNAFSDLDLSSLEWTYSSTYQRFSTTSQVVVIKTPHNNNTVANILCSHFNSDTSNNTAEVGKDNIIGVSMTGVIQIRDTSLNGDISALMTLLENVDFVYELATPTEYTFTGQPIESLLGVNNVWTDVGSTKVTYKYKTGEGGSSKKKYLPIFYDFYRKEKQS